MVGGKLACTVDFGYPLRFMGASEVYDENCDLF
jgi:hypothetical protein